MPNTAWASPPTRWAGCRRYAVIQLPEWNEPLVLINPEIIRREGEREVEEGCLSIPGYRGTVKRSERVRARALDLNGKVVRIKADGLLAQALEHETDHLNGVLYIDHLVSRESFWKITYEADPPEPTDDEPTDDEPTDDEPTDGEPTGGEPTGDEAAAQESQEPRESREQSE